MKYEMTLTGVAPILAHNIRLANPLDPIAREMKTISSRRKKTDEDHALLARLEWTGSLYYDPDMGPYLPSAWVEGALVDGARVMRLGKKVTAGVIVLDDAPLQYDGPRDLEGLWADDRFRDVRAVRVSSARVMRTRPVFRDWSATFEVLVEGDVLTPRDFEEVVALAGRVGVGDYRPKFGRFTATLREL